MASPITTTVSKVVPKVIPKVGVVIAAGRCLKTVKVRVAETVKEGHIRKYLVHHDDFLAHDENSSCVVGDIVTVHPGRTSSTKRHVVTSIISAIATPNPRPPPETYEEYLARREAEYNARRLRKLNGENAEKYFIKYKNDLPKVVKELKKIWLAKKRAEEEEKKRVLMEQKKAEELEKEEKKLREEKRAIREAKEKENEEKKRLKVEKEKEQKQEGKDKGGDGSGSGVGGTPVL